MKNAIFISASVLVLLSAASATPAGMITGTVTAKGVKDARDVVVYIEKAKGDTTSYKPPEEHAVMDQKNLVFIPHVLPVLVGTTVDFKNSDDILHNVFSPDKVADKFNLGTWAKGLVRSFTFKKPGSAVILCNVHPEMEAYVVVLPTPYFANTGKDGVFTIENVPAGKYTLRTWHERLKPQSEEVAVAARETTTIDFALSR